MTQLLLERKRQPTDQKWNFQDMSEKHKYIKHFSVRAVYSK